MSQQSWKIKSAGDNAWCPNSILTNIKIARTPARTIQVDLSAHLIFHHKSSKNEEWNDVEKIYKITRDDFRAAVVLIAGYKDCGKEDCECCMMVMELLDDEEVQ